MAIFKKQFADADSYEEWLEKASGRVNVLEIKNAPKIFGSSAAAIKRPGHCKVPDTRQVVRCSVALGVEERPSRARRGGFPRAVALPDVRSVAQSRSASRLREITSRFRCAFPAPSQRSASRACERYARASAAACASAR